MHVMHEPLTKGQRWKEAPSKILIIDQPSPFLEMAKVGLRVSFKGLKCNLLLIFKMF